MNSGLETNGQLVRFVLRPEKMSFRVILAYLRKLPANQAVAPPARQLWQEARSTLPTARDERDGAALPWGRHLGTAGTGDRHYVQS